MIGALGRWPWWANTVMAACVALLWVWDSRWAILGGSVGALLAYWIIR